MKKEKTLKERKSEILLELQEERESIFKKIDDLGNVIHVLEATANHYYGPHEHMWNVLLKARDNIKKHIEKEEMQLYKQVDEIDKKLSDLKLKQKAGDLVE